MKRREFIIKTTTAVATLAGSRVRAAAPCPPPALAIDSDPPIATSCEPPPSWVPAPGQWAAVGLNTLLDVEGPAPVTGNPFASDGGFHKIWAGGAYAPGYGGRYGSMIYGPNGGHSSYDGSDVYAYDIESRMCSLVRATYNPTSAGVNGFGEFPDGSPCPPHGYDGHVVLPNVGAQGTLVVPQSYTSLQDANQRTAWSHLLDLATKEWRRGPDFVNPIHPASAYDPVASLMWYYPEPLGPLTSFDGTKVVMYNNNSYAISQPSVATLDTRRNQFVHLAFIDDGQPNRLFVTDLANPDKEPGGVDMPSGGPSANCAFEYVQDIDKIVGWGNGQTVYTLDPKNYAAGWQAQAVSGSVTPPSPPQGTYSKYMYCAGVRCLIGISDVNQPAYAYRVIGT